MIPRYEMPEISKIWTLEEKYKIYLDVELAIMAALELEGITPKGTSDKIKNIAKINVQRIDEIEQITKHDVIAFCTSITEQLDPKLAHYFHYGVTSSDIIDTAMGIQLKRSLEVIEPAFKKLLDSIFKRAKETKNVLAMGRSHGMFAEPLSFGQKLLSHYAELKRRYDDFNDFINSEITGQFSGAVGNYTLLSTSVEKNALEKLGLEVEKLSTQVIPRDRLAKLVSINALTASAIERLAVEIRHLHHSDIAEIHEGFSKGQKGSSIMPHKKNPISGENLTGISRVLRSHLNIALENNILWHERDISHSSAERLYLPDNLGLLLYSIQRLDSTIENLVIHEEKIEAKVLNNHTYLSSYYLHELIKNTDLHREELYPLLQEAAFATQDKDLDSFRVELEKLCKSKNIKAPEFEKLDKAQLKKIYLREIDNIFARFQ